MKELKNKHFDFDNEINKLVQVLYNNLKKKIKKKDLELIIMKKLNELNSKKIKKTKKNKPLRVPLFYSDESD